MAERKCFSFVNKRSRIWIVKTTFFCKKRVRLRTIDVSPPTIAKREPCWLRVTLVYFNMLKSIYIFSLITLICQWDKVNFHPKQNHQNLIHWMLDKILLSFCGLWWTLWQYYFYSKAEALTFNYLEFELWSAHTHYTHHCRMGFIFRLSNSRW